MRAASQHLASVSLELGGKSPVIVEKDADIAVTAKRILHGKSLNCGQICLAPDYVLLHRKHSQAFFDEAKKVLATFFPQGQANSPDYPRIVNRRHWNRLKGLLDSTPNADVVLGGDGADEDTKFFPTTIVRDPRRDCRLLQEEIFGPILPVLLVDSIEEAVFEIKSREKPLGLYIFSKNKKTIDYVLEHTSSGGVSINDVLMHIAAGDMGFGGVGPSGMGAYKGSRGFNEFSHLRSVYHASTSVELTSLVRYPPYTSFKTNLIRTVMTQGGMLPPAAKKVLANYPYIFMAIFAFFVYRSLR